MASYSRIIRKLTELSEASVSRNSFAVWVECTPLELRHDQVLVRLSRNEAECRATRPYVRGRAFLCFTDAVGFWNSFADFLSLLKSETESLSACIPSSSLDFLDATPIARWARWRTMAS